MSQGFYEMKTNLRPTVIIPMIGDPIAQVATPVIWNEAFQSEKKNCICVPIHLKDQGLGSFVAWVRHAENVPGFLSTIPHKNSLPALCDHVRAEVEFLGVANTVSKKYDGQLECAMFDGEGMIRAIEAVGGVIEDSTILIIGCGAAGGAIAFEALQKGARTICLIDRMPDTATHLVKKLQGRFKDKTIKIYDPSDISFEFIINASPLGSRPNDELPYDLKMVSPNSIIADAVTEPCPTNWVAQANTQGFITVNGNNMAAAQADAMRLYLGV